MKAFHDFLRLDQLTETQIGQVTARAGEVAQPWTQGAEAMPQTLRGRRIGLITEGSGWRNATVFVLARQSMGAYCVQISASLQGTEPVADLAGYLDNWFDLLGVRSPQLADLEELADAARAPVVNLRTRQN